MNLANFLENVADGHLSELEALNFTEQVTGGFKVDKLRLLLYEIDIKIIERKEEYLEINRDKVLSLINQYKQEGKELPYIQPKQPKPGAPPAAWKIFELQKENKQIDLIQVLGGGFHLEIYPLYELKKIVISKIKSTDKERSFTDIEKRATSKKLSKKTEALKPTDFSHLLNERGQTILPRLLQLYKNRRFKKDYVVMIFALNDLSLLADKFPTFSQTFIHEALANSFDRMGGRQNFNTYYQVYNNPRNHELKEILQHKQQIEKVLKEL